MHTVYLCVQQIHILHMMEQANIISPHSRLILQSMHWTVEKHTPSLQETSEGDQHVPSHHGNQGHTSLGKGDGSDPLKEFRQGGFELHCSELTRGMECLLIHLLHCMYVL